MSAVVSSTDLERSREFYEQQIGLTLSPETIPNHLLFEGGDGTTLLVYRRPSPNLADHTQLRFWCADVAADVSELVGRGVGVRPRRVRRLQDGRPRAHDASRQLCVVQRPGRKHNSAGRARLAPAR